MLAVATLNEAISPSWYSFIHSGYTNAFSLRIQICLDVQVPIVANWKNPVYVYLCHEIMKQLSFSLAVSVGICSFVGREMV